MSDLPSTTAEQFGEQVAALDDAMLATLELPALEPVRRHVRRLFACRYTGDLGSDLLLSQAADSAARVACCYASGDASRCGRAFTCPHWATCLPC